MTLQHHDIFQTDRADCGVTCLAIVAQLLGRPVDLASLKARFPSPADGTNLVDLLAISNQLGMTGRALRADIEQLSHVATPAILHFGMFHFVVLERVDKHAFVVRDPALGTCRLSRLEMSARFTGVIVEFQAETNGIELRALEPLTILSVLRAVPRIHIRLAAIALTALCAQLSLFLFPMYIKAFIEFVLLPGNTSMIYPILAIAIFALGVTLVFKRIKRGLTDKVISDADFALARFLNRLVLSMDFRFFQRKSPGTIAMSFSALRSIRSLIADGCIDAVVELATLCLLVGLCFALDLRTGLALLALIVVYFGIIIALHASRHGALRQSAILDAAETTALRENLRNIQAIKINGLEQVRALIWQTAYSRAATCVESLRRLDGRAELIGEFIMSGGRLLIVATAAIAFLSGAFTLGTFFALTFYLILVTVSVSALSQKIGRLWDIDLHLHDISALALEPRDGMSKFANEDADCSESAVFKVDTRQPRLEINDLAFRYETDLPRVLRRVNLSVMQGEIVAIKGSSGSGKSTLLKLALGLYATEAGGVTWNGRPLDQYSRQSLGKVVSTVMQEDQLFSGTLLQNISGFSSQPDLERVKRACKAASADGFIAATKAGLHTLVAGGVETFSMGERQRLYLARALYLGADTLLLDEFTGNIDTDTEAEIFKALRSMGKTILMTAHRQSTLDQADRIYEMDRPNRTLRAVGA